MGRRKNLGAVMIQRRCERQGDQMFILIDSGKEAGKWQDRDFSE
jgi:hypothetical protein